MLLSRSYETCSGETIPSRPTDAPGLFRRGSPRPAADPRMGRDRRRSRPIVNGRSRIEVVRMKNLSEPGRCAQGVVTTARCRGSPGCPRAEPQAGRAVPPLAADVELGAVAPQPDHVDLVRAAMGVETADPAVTGGHPSHGQARLASQQLSRPSTGMRFTGWTFRPRSLPLSTKSLPCQLFSDCGSTTGRDRLTGLGIACCGTPVVRSRAEAIS